MRSGLPRRRLPEWPRELRLALRGLHRGVVSRHRRRRAARGTRSSRSARRRPAPHVLWRHDVDYSLHRALVLARIEAELGARATYFLSLHSDLYNVLEPAVHARAREIAALGHWIGLHFDAGFYADGSLDERAAWEGRVLSEALEVPVRARVAPQPVGVGDGGPRCRGARRHGPRGRPQRARPLRVRVGLERLLAVRAAAGGAGSRRARAAARAHASGVVAGAGDEPASSGSCAASRAAAGPPRPPTTRCCPTTSASTSGCRNLPGEQGVDDRQAVRGVEVLRDQLDPVRRRTARPPGSPRRRHRPDRRSRRPRGRCRSAARWRGRRRRDPRRARSASRCRALGEAADGVLVVGGEPLARDSRRAPRRGAARRRAGSSAAAS